MTSPVKPTPPSKSLSKVLGQSEQVKTLVEECADELATVNTVLKQELAEREPLPQIENVLEKSESIENKVQEASDKLTHVNKELQHEVREREVLEHQLASAVKQEEASRHASFHDSLTGLPNRVLFNDRLEHGVAMAKRHDWMLAVMFVDLDGFKAINDSYGHDVGDAVLQIVATRLKENTRGDDTVSRHGGDEFLYLLMEIQSEQDVVLIAEKIIAAIQAPCEVSHTQRNIVVSVDASIGISIYPKDGDTADGLVKSADKAMYEAKREQSGYSFSQ